MSTDERDYLPALRFRSLTAVYDPVIRWTTREALFKPRLLEQARIEPGHQVLDLGCGTGTLSIMAKQRQPEADLVGLDADPEMLVQADAKAAQANLQLRFDEGFSDRLPYKEGSFDRVLSTLFFHHLDDAGKSATIAEIARVLKPGGALHVADWGRPADPLMRGLFLSVRMFDGWEQTRPNVAGALPELFEDGGLRNAAERGRLRTAFGTLSLYSAEQDAPR